MKQESKKSEIETKINKGLEQNSHLFWNSFQHMYDVRERIMQNKINFLLLVATFLPLLSVTLYNTDFFKDEIVLIPIIFQFAAILILLKDFFSGGDLLHWFEFQSTLRSIAKDEFQKDFFCSLKALESGTHKNMDYKYDKIIKPSLYLIIFSLFAVLFSVISIALKINIWSYLILLFLFLLLSIMLIYYYKPFTINTKKKFENYKRQFSEVIKQIEDESRNENN